MKNFGLALIEAVITLLITQIPLWIGTVIYALGDKNASVQSALSVTLKSFTPGDGLVYSAGILASSTAYAIMKIGNFKRRPWLMIPLIILPFIAVILAIPIYIQDSNEAIQNVSFARTYTFWVLLFSSFLWVYALYQARAFFEVHLPNSRGSEKIIEELEG